MEQKGPVGSPGVGHRPLREKKGPALPNWQRCNSILSPTVIRFQSQTALIERRITLEYFIARFGASADGPALPLRRLQAGGWSLYRLINVSIVKSYKGTAAGYQQLMAQETNWQWPN
jgi:hypothetical protein